MWCTIQLECFLAYRNCDSNRYTDDEEPKLRIPLITYLTTEGFVVGKTPLDVAEAIKKYVIVESETLCTAHSNMRGYTLTYRRHKCTVATQSSYAVLQYCVLYQGQVDVLLSGSFIVWFVTHVVIATSFQNRLRHMSRFQIVRTYGNWLSLSHAEENVRLWRVWWRYGTSETAVQADTFWRQEDDMHRFLPRSVAHFFIEKEARTHHIRNAELKVLWLRESIWEAWRPHENFGLATNYRKTGSFSFGTVCHR